MRNLFAQDRGLVTVVGVCASLAMMYGLVVSRAASVHSVSTQPPSQPEATSPSQVTSTADVPSSAVTAIVQSLRGVVRGDELVVLGDPSGWGYDVSMTVDLGENRNAPQAAWGATADADVGDYFRGVFGSGQPVQSAEIYFLLGGQLVAGAGLGKSSYEALTVSTTNQGPYSLAQSVLDGPQDAQGGPDESWFALAAVETSS